jgi:hypothetical protein
MPTDKFLLFELSDVLFILILSEFPRNPIIMSSLCAVNPKDTQKSRRIFNPLKDSGYYLLLHYNTHYFAHRV